MKPDSGVLPLVLTAIIVVTALRGLFLYLHQVTTMRIVLRMVTDIQKAAFAHLVNADYARITRETTGQLVSRLTNDLTFIQQAAQTSLVAFVKDALSVVAVYLRDALPGLADDADHARRCARSPSCRSATSAAAALGIAPHPGRAGRRHVAAHGEAVRRAADQGVPARGLRRASASTRTSSRSSSCA